LEARAMSSSTKQRMKIGDFLLRRLKEAGVRHLFGVPGDYNLELLQQLQDSGALKWIGTTNELNASYAADGYARLNGLGALLVTNGVGPLAAINGVGGSYSEHVPVICIAGSIPLRSVDRGLGMHHTMADGSYDHFLNAYAHVTAAHARLTPRNAATEIDRLIVTAWRDKLPVYMELPSDIAYLDIEVPSDPLLLADPPSDPERLRSCIAAIAGRLSAATLAAILVDADADRFGVAPELMELAEKLQAPIAVIVAAKAAIDETFAHYLGVYNGKAREPHVREAIETSDCLLAIGYRPIEVTTGDFTASLPANTIHARGHSVDVGDDNYQAVTLREVLQGVIDAVPQVRNRAPRPAAAAASRRDAEPSAKLTQSAYWQAMQGYLREAIGLAAWIDSYRKCCTSAFFCPVPVSASRGDRRGLPRHHLPALCALDRVPRPNFPGCVQAHAHSRRAYHSDVIALRASCDRTYIYRGGSQSPPVFSAGPVNE
jgi:indolepyruvate decarboxylase